MEKETWQERLKDEFVSTINTGGDKFIPSMIADWWINKLDLALSKQKEEMVERIKKLHPHKYAREDDEKGKEIQGDYNWGYNSALQDIINLIKQ